MAWIVFSLLLLPPKEITALHVSHLWVTAMTGKQEPWMVRITGDDRYPMQLRGFSGESITHTGRSAVEMSNSLS